MIISNALSFTRRTSRLLMLAVILAAAVPVSMSIGTDGAAYAQSKGRGSNAKGGSEGGGGSPALDCASGSCRVVERIIIADVSNDCVGARCGDDRKPPCVGPSCDTSTDDKPRISYAVTPAGCEVKTCEVQGNRSVCVTKLAKDERLCVKKRT